jgi:hypothetical protein
MIPLNAIKLIGLSVSLTMLAACGDGKISAVKDTRLRGDEFTVGETLSKIKECKSTDWASEIVDNATIVTHTCTVKLDESIFTASKEKALHDLDDAVRITTENHRANVIKTQGRREHALADDGGDVAKLNEKLVSIEKENAKLDEPFVFVRRFLADTEEMARPQWEADKARQRTELAAEKERALNDVAEAKSSQQKRLEESTRVLEAIQPWLPKYAEALAQTKAAVIKEIDAAFDKSHTAEVKTVFRYREGRDAELIDSALFVDGRKRSSTIPVYLVDPKRMQEYIDYTSKDGFAMGIREMFDQLFPIESDRTIGSDFDGYGYKYKEAKPGA